MRSGIIAGLAVVMFAGSAFAGILVQTEAANLWGTNYQANHWFVRDDAGLDVAEAFEPEGMTFYNGALYASGDSDESNSRLVHYTPGATGDLSSPSVTALSAGGLSYGPEGMTVNTGGSGYGGGGGLVSVESGNDDDSIENEAGLIDPGTGAVTLVHAPGSAFDATLPPDQQEGGFSPDDIAYVASLDQFAVIQDPNTVEFHTHTAAGLTPANNWFGVPGVTADAKGLAVVSEAFGEMLTGEDIVGSEAFLIVSEGNELVLVQLDGTLIGGVQALPTLSSGAEIEAVTVDEFNDLLYVGDEAGLTITAILVPEPTTLGLLGLAGLALLRRRR